jgi:hypothetical protein
MELVGRLLRGGEGPTPDGPPEDAGGEGGAVP